MKSTLLRRRERFHGRVFTLVDRTVVLPNGRKATYDIVEHPGAVAIVPVHENGDVVLLRQFRVAAGGEIWEIPAGTREAGEAPARTARRELAEETGLRASRWTKLGAFFTAPGFCTERIAVYLARGLEATAGGCEPDEVLRPRRVPFAEAVRMIDRGIIRDAKTIAGLHLARTRLND
ncbi:MAG TPA: NUDIX hydrolase [Candidatus Eisenbacteria bacterium]|nr:NUDIX hydrolase [Candidatus Eisenbacteria bacterium]